MGLDPALFSKRTKVPILQYPLYIKKTVFLRLKRRGSKSFLGARPPVPFLLFFALKRGCNEDHWTSEIAKPVDFPHYFLCL